MMPGRALLVAAATLAWPALAQGAIVGPSTIDGSDIVYAADRGEQNRLAISRESDQVVFEDPGATIAPGFGCRSLAPNRVSCGDQYSTALIAQLEDGDDEMSSSGEVTQASIGVTVVYAEGDQGADTLHGSADRGYLFGGPGPDRLFGGAGTESISGADIVGRGDPFRQVRARDEIVCAIRAGNAQPTMVDANRVDQVVGPCSVAPVFTGRDRDPFPGFGGGCRDPRRPRVLARTGHGIVFQGRRGVYGCLFRQGVNRLLPDEGGGISERRPRPRLSGRYVAYATFGSAIGDEFDRVYVYDLKRGRRFTIETAGAVSRIVLKRNGSVAWVQVGRVQGPGGFGDSGYEVRKVAEEEQEGNVLLDRGAGIDPTSLRLGRGRETVRWTNSGAGRRSSLR